ncbi:MAG TPA: prepilin-type N-terminal cleavage/methylation domain-containing protein, partial [Hyphomicrobiales bacterium]|nr:prepilin-type N-terminal cleavage/methylation domain-containing protein [Hyphomicrobiales bacterium]
MLFVRFCRSFSSKHSCSWTPFYRFPLFKQSAFTLLELLVCLVLVGVLLVSGAPGLQGWVQRSQADQAQARLLGLLQYARNSALSFGVPVSVCGSRVSGVCD